MSYILGIDPGIRGGLAIISSNDGAAPTLVDAIDVPTVGTGAKERVNVLLIQEWLLQHGPTFAFIERGQAMPRQGASSGFKYGRSVGSAEATITLCGMPRWLDSGENNITGTCLTAVGLLRVVNKWNPSDKPLVTRILERGQKFPNFKELNAKEPESEWRERFGKMVGPWSGQHCLYFVDRFYNWYTWPSPLSTVGSVICIRELSEQINFVRGMRPNVNPVCELGIADFPTGYGMRQRPHLVKIRDWVILGPQGALPPADSAPEIAPSDVGGAPLDAQSVTPPSAKEVTGDEIMF
jgi:hypothetical protein